MALAALAGAFAQSAVTGSRGDWVAVVGSLQRVVDVACAAQDAAIVRVAAIEAELVEDGTVVESHRAVGHVALDAPALVSGVLAVSAVHAEARVRAAVALAGDGPAGSGTDSGLGGLHAAMRAGRLDAYRAGLVAQELEAAPPEVRATVVAALDGHLGVEDGAHLRRRCRRVLARISPDLLRQRAQRARAQCGLRRWVDEPGVDRWEGTFPSEDAARAWAAIDALARRYLAEGGCPTLERARAKALTDLVAGNATIDTVLTLTVPATALPGDGDDGPAFAPPRPEPVPEPQSTPEPDVRPEPRPQSATVTDVQPEEPSRVREGDLVEVTGLHGSQPVLVSRRWLAATVEDQHAGTTAACHPTTGALLDEEAQHTPTIGAHTGPDSPNPATDDTARDVRDVRDVRETADPVGTGTERDARATEDVRRVAAAFGADRYRPSDRLVRLVRARDRRCRFPGCTVAAVFCDLDHVRPWPAGPTAAANLICLCRRHHRIKQRPGWRVVLAADGTTTWTDPTGRVRTTDPVNALHATVLLHPPDATSAGGTAGALLTASLPGDSTSRSRTLVPDGPHSELEFLLEHLGAAPPGPAAAQRRHGRHRRDVVPQPACLLLDPGGHHPGRPRATGRCHDADPPPF